jgi:hypothetical protein
MLTGFLGHKEWMMYVLVLKSHVSTDYINIFLIIVQGGF